MFSRLFLVFFSSMALSKAFSSGRSPAGIVSDPHKAFYRPPHPSITNSYYYFLQHGRTLASSRLEKALHNMNLAELLRMSTRSGPARSRF